MIDRYAEIVEELEYELMLCQRGDGGKFIPGLERALQIINELKNDNAE